MSLPPIVKGVFAKRVRGLPPGAQTLPYGMEFPNTFFLGASSK